jgi:hypothetical protein
MDDQHPTDARADSVQTRSYPAAAKKLLQSRGVKVVSASAMAVQRASTDRAAALRRAALSLAKAISMGLRSGD